MKILPADNPNVTPYSNQFISFSQFVSRFNVKGLLALSNHISDV
jgi:hypothetical protein